MRVFAIGDLHLSGNPPKKPMHIFGEHWQNHWENIKASWLQKINAEDIVLLLGDISWAMNLEEATVDLEELIKLPGKKYMIRGNHDYWWSSVTKMTKLTEGKIAFLQGHSTGIESITFGGSRGYLCPGDTYFKVSTDTSIYERELLRVEAALKEMTALKPEGTKLLLLHYPPFNDSNEPSGFTNLLEKYKVDHCLFGHLHDAVSFQRIPSTWGNTKLHLVSADYLHFKLKEIL